MDLLRRWLDVVGDRPGAAGAGRALLARYAERHRRYHDALHLGEVLDALERLAPKGAAPWPAVCAAWWHDAVYDPRRDDNEERSARLATDVLAGLSVDPALHVEVARLVRLTATHRPSAGDRAGALLCDADLAVLAAAPDRYAAYVRGIRQEYAHLDDAAFAAGRADVLRRLLAGPRVYTSPVGQAWEAAARANVTAELALLPGPAGTVSEPGSGRGSDAGRPPSAG